MITQQGYVARTLVNGGVEQPNVWAGGGAATNCTKQWGQGISSVAYNAATGKYLITFTEVGYQDPQLVIDAYDVSTNTRKWNVKKGNYDSSAKTLLVWVYDDTTLTDLTTTARLSINVMWCDSTVPQ